MNTTPPSNPLDAPTAPICQVYPAFVPAPRALRPARPTQAPYYPPTRKFQPADYAAMARSRSQRFSTSVYWMLRPARTAFGFLLFCLGVNFVRIAYTLPPLTPVTAVGVVIPLINRHVTIPIAGYASDVLYVIAKWQQTGFIGALVLALLLAYIAVRICMFKCNMSWNPATRK